MNAKPQDPRPGVSTHDRCLQSTDETAPATHTAMHAVVPAAGTGQRFDARGNPESKPKQYRELAGEPV
ncbi:MAG: hypothetical protein EBX62_06075, partial [Betaproteobacteria bacterium]|nr:hypothetical protein [Betaproteobacteria bacterium]